MRGLGWLMGAHARRLEIAIVVRADPGELAAATGLDGEPVPVEPPPQRAAAAPAYAPSTAAGSSEIEVKASTRPVASHSPTAESTCADGA